MDYKKFCTIGILLILLGITGCQANFENGNNDSIENSIENSVETEEMIESEEAIESEEEISVEEQLQIDAQDKEIINAFRDFAWEEEYDFVERKTFSDLKQEMAELSSENLFAEEFVKMSKSVPYDSYDEVSRLAFDSYLKLLFQEEYYEITDDTLGEFTEAWSGEYTDANTLFLFMRLTDVGDTTFRSDMVDVIGLKYFEVRHNRNDDTIRTYWANFDSSLQNEDNRTIYLGSIFTDEVKTFVVEDVKQQLNEMLDSNKDFLDYLVSYRDNVYAPTRNILLSAEREEKDEQNRIDRELSEKEPEIGMTAEEVRKTKWGYPDDINKDTYSWGTKEQWVYDGWGYVYFENGIVTSVSER